MENAYLNVILINTIIYKHNHVYHVPIYLAINAQNVKKMQKVVLNVLILII